MAEKQPAHIAQALAELDSASNEEQQKAANKRLEAAGYQKAAEKRSAAAAAEAAAEAKAASKAPQGRQAPGKQKA